MAAPRSSPNKLLVIWGGLFILPLLYLIAFRVAMVQQGPHFWGGSIDPSYAYLLNALNIVVGVPPWHTDHPGTPIQLLGALVLQVSYRLQSWRSPMPHPLVETVLTNPEPFLSHLNLLLLGINTIILAAVGWVAFRVTQRLPMALILQTTPFLIANLLLIRHVNRVSPEHLLFGICQLIVLLLLVYLYREGVSRKPWFASCLGVLLGTGMATKVTLFPALLFVFVLPGLKQKTLAVGMAVASFVVSTLPIVGDYPRVGQWVWSMVVRRGRYGRGEVGLEYDKWGERFLLLFNQGSWFFWCVMAATVIAVVLAVKHYRQKGVRGVWQSFIPPVTASRSHKAFFLLLLTLAAIWMQVAMTINEAVRLRYMALPLSLMGLLIVLLLNLWDRLPRWTETLVLCLCIVLGSHQWGTAQHVSLMKAQAIAQDLTAIQQISQAPAYQACARLNGYLRTSTLEAGLSFGNHWSGKTFAPLLQQLYPNTVSIEPAVLDPNRPEYRSFTGVISAAEIQRMSPQGCLLYQTGHPMQPSETEFLRAKQARLLYDGSEETLYYIAAP